LVSFPAISQKLVSYVTVSPDNVYIGEPVQLKVSVFTTTWFTAGVDVGNIQIDGALTVYFRSVSTNREFGGKKYSGVDLLYNIFPTNEGVITVPSLSINVESPKKGDYKGIKRIIKTKPKTINVKGVPLGYNPNNWLVATSLNINERWSSSIKDVKVGDVIQRSITRTAGGTLSEFIPETQWDSISGISIYPQRAIVNTHKSKTAVSSSRTETVNYLFEKEGQIIIPGIDYSYWNSYSKKFYHKQIDSVTINVKPNADLAMLASIKKSLQEEQEELVKEEKDEPFLILGMTIKEFSKYLILIVVAVVILIYILKKSRKYFIKNKAKKLQSEAYAYRKVTKSIRNNNYFEFIKELNFWLLKLSRKPIGFTEFTDKYGTDELKKVLIEMNEAYFKNHTICDDKSFRALNVAMNKSRKNYFIHQKKSKDVNKRNNWLNPTNSI
jgi:hypothetical protein